MLAIDLTGNHALVCGSSQGIGRAIALQLAEAGAEITLLARNEAALQEVVKTLPGSGHQYLVADFSRPDLLENIADKLENGRFDILINNTGGPPPGPVHQATWQDFSSALDMHLQMGHQLMKFLLPGMKERSYGRIINVISTSVKIPLDGLGVSNTVRGAVASWSKTLANELGPFNITVNNLLPGFMETQRLEQIITNKALKSGQAEDQVVEKMKKEVPAKRFGQPQEMGNIAAFLASPLAGYINGASIPVDGGRTGSI